MTALTKALLRRRFLVVAAALALAGYGYHRYRRLPVEAFPDVSPKLVQVFTVTKGLAPEEVERYVTYPLEVAMNGLPKLRLIRSLSNFGLSVINIYFEDDTDIYLARQLVNERIRVATEQIPEGFGHPQLGPISTSMGLVLFYYLRYKTGRRSLTELRTIQDWIVAPILRTVPGVTEVLGIGGWEKQFQVVVRPEDLHRYDLTILDVIEQIEENNANEGAQFLVMGGEEHLVRLVGLVGGLSDLARIVVKTHRGIPIYLPQVADLRVGGKIRRGLQTRNGREEVVAGMVVKLYGTNSATVIDNVEKKLAQVRRTLPKGVELVAYYQQKSLIQAAVGTVNDALVQGIILVVLVLALFIGGIRPSLVAAGAIPFSILFAAVGLWAFGMTANLMTLGGLAIAIGMLVDGAIVVVENVERRLRLSGPDSTTESRSRAVVQATAEVAKPISFAIAIIIIVFLPLFTLQGVEGKTFRPLAYTVALAMAGSLVYSLLIAPTLAHLLMREPGPSIAPNEVARAGRLQRTIRTVKAWLAAWPRWVDGSLSRIYRPVVRFSVHKRWISLCIAALLLTSGVVAFTRLGSEFTPTLQEGTIILRLTMASSISLQESTRLTKIVERRVLRVPEVAEVVTRIGRGEVGAHTDPVNSAEMYIILKPKQKWRGDWTQRQLEKIIRKKVGRVPGMVTNFTQPIQMTLDELMEGVRAELAIKIYGEDLESLKKTADQVAAVIRKVPGAADVAVDQVSGQPQILIRIDRKAAARWGIDVKDIEKVVSAAVGGGRAGQVFEGVRRFDIQVRYHSQSRSTIREISNILLKSPLGQRVPLSQLATITPLVGPRQITREDTRRFITVQCNVRGRDIGGFVAQAKRRIRKTISMPPGTIVKWGGQYKLQQEANARLAVVVPVTLLLILVMLYLTFNRLRDVALIAVNIPLALTGGLVALWLTGQNLSVPASVGFIALFGIALENALMLVAVMNRFKKEGMAPRQAAIEGAVHRIRAVLMTATTTGLGLVPLIVATGTGSEVQRPLATVVTAGLLTATVLTLIVLPTLYAWIARDEPRTATTMTKES